MPDPRVLGEGVSRVMPGPGHRGRRQTASAGGRTPSPSTPFTYRPVPLYRDPLFWGHLIPATITALIAVNL